MIIVADWPPAKSASAKTLVGTSTGNFVPALGPEPMTRSSRALPPSAPTRRIGPSSCTSAVK